MSTTPPDGPSPEGNAPETPGRAGGFVDAFLLSVGTLTAIPVPPPRVVDRRVAGGAMLLAPVAVLPLAALAGLLTFALTRLGAPDLLAGGLVVTALALGTRGMHLDGLADLADGLSAGFDPARSLEVMKRSDIGPSGVVALVLAVILQVGALTALVGWGGGAATVIVAVLASRSVLAWACRRGMPAASPGGLGATVAGTVSPVGLAGATLAIVAAAAVAGLAWNTAAPLAAVAAAGLGALVVLARARRRLGGVTGDVLGATIEVACTSALAVAAVVVTLS